MPSFRLTLGAQSDLIEIRRYSLQEWGVVQSQKYLSELRKVIALVAESPALGKARPEVGTNVFSFPHHSHVIYYMIHDQQVVVFGVLHKRTVPLNHLVDRELI